MATTAVAFAHHEEPISWSTLFQPLVQTGAWLLARGALLGPLKIAHLNLFLKLFRGNLQARQAMRLVSQAMPIVEMAACPALEFGLMKYWSDWNYHQSPA